MKLPHSRAHRPFVFHHLDLLPCISDHAVLEVFERQEELWTGRCAGKRGEGVAGRHGDGERECSGSASTMDAWGPGKVWLKSKRVDLCLGKQVMKL